MYNPHAEIVMKKYNQEHPGQIYAHSKGASSYMYSRTEEYILVMRNNKVGLYHYLVVNGIDKKERCEDIYNFFFNELLKRTDRTAAFDYLVYDYLNKEAIDSSVFVAMSFIDTDEELIGILEDNIMLFDKMYEIYTNAKLAVELEKL